jgi:hypothetical protein
LTCFVGFAVRAPLSLPDIGRGLLEEVLIPSALSFRKVWQPWARAFLRARDICSTPCTRRFRSRLTSSLPEPMELINRSSLWSSVCRSLGVPNIMEMSRGQSQGRVDCASCATCPRFGHPFQIRTGHGHRPEKYIGQIKSKNGCQDHL